MIARFPCRSGTALALVLASPVWAAGQASAQDQGSPTPTDAEVTQLRGELAQLTARLEALQTRLEEQDARIAEANAAGDEASGTRISWKGAPELASTTGWSFKPRGRLQFDFGHVDAPDGIANDGLGFSNELRRVRLGAEGAIPGGFGYRFDVEFGGGDAQLWDGYITYKDGGLTITAGQQNTFQSLDELTSSNDTVFVERAAFTDAFGFERRVGLSAQYAAGPVLLQGGVFTDNVADLANDGNNSWSTDGRIVLAPKVGSAQLHLAGSAHWRDLGDAIGSTRYRQRPLIHSTDIRFIDTGTIAGAKSETSYGLEALAIAGRFHVAGEAHWFDLSRDTGPDARFFGGYAEVGYFLTGDGLGYRGGVLRAPKIAKPLSDGGIGAVALSLRYDYLDLVDASAGVFGGKQNGVIAGISWWPVENLRFLLDYAHLSYDGAALPAAGDDSYSVDVVGGRAQVSF